MDKSGPKERRLSDQQIWVAVICQVTGWNSATMGGRAAKLVKKLKAGGATKETVLAHYGQYDFGEAWWWYRDHWLGKKGERPNDRWMLETWGLWEKPIAVAGVSQGRLAVEMVTDAKGISRPKLTPEQQAIKDQFFSQDAAHADH